MKNIITAILCGLLFLTLPTWADTEPPIKSAESPATAPQCTPQCTTTRTSPRPPRPPEISVDVKLQELKLESFKAILDYQDKRIGDLTVNLSMSIALFGVLITGIVVFFSFRSTREAIQAAKDEARKEVEKQAKEVIESWLNKDGRQLLSEKVESALRPEVDRALGEIRSATSGVLKGLEEEQRKAHDQNAEHEQLINHHEKAFNELMSNVLSKDRPLTHAQADKATKELESKPPKEYSFDDWYMLGVQAVDSAKYEVAADYFGKAVGVATEPSLQAAALGNKGVMLGLLERTNEEILVYDEIVHRFGDLMDVEVREQVAKALVNKGVTLGRAGRQEEAINIYDDVVRRYSDAIEIELREPISRALVNKGFALGQMGRSNEEIAVYDEVVHRFGGATEAELLEQVANALLNKAITLGQIGRNDEEVKIYDEMVRRFGDAGSVALREAAATALMNKGITLGDMGQNDSEISAYNDLIRRYGNAGETELRNLVAGAFNSIGFIMLRDAKRVRKEGDESLATSMLMQALEKVELALQRNSEDSMYLGNKGYILFLLGRREDALQVLKRAIALGGEKLRQDELKDADIHSLPQDEEFKTLIKSI